MEPDNKTSHAKTPVSASPHKSGETDATAAYPSPPNSPPLHEHETRRETPQINLKNEGLKPPALEVLLGINNWRCGAITQKNKPCRWPISHELRRQINVYLDSMLALHQSPRLRDDLEKLIDLVHCYHHKRGPPKQRRLDEWISAFPLGPERISCRASIENDIASSLGLVTPRCIGIAQTGTRCKKTIGGQKVVNCTKTINQVCKAEVYLSDIALKHYLQVLAVNMSCYYHTDQSLSKMVATWKERILAIREEANMSPVKMQGSSTSIDEGQRSSGTDLERKPTQLCPSAECLTNPAMHWPSQYDTTPLDILERSKSQNDYKASYDALRSRLSEKLEEDDEKSGYVYIYEAKENKGFVKIGYTTRTINVRHDEWSFDCNRESVLLFPVPATKAGRVPNARRVEKLCHAELSHRHIIIYCNGCSRTHNEWFEISPAEAITVVKKWTAWVVTKPYLPDKSLKEEEAKKVCDMNRFMDDLSHMSRILTLHPFLKLPTH
ncbi:T5orf172 domain-containing protein [Aspergillus ambiguus]|uniref:GIY-YIG nuclease family protein n=1 Tax=Aspergillus ambiguus TaxID=176160 RepID=UPI003CCDE9B3